MRCSRQTRGLTVDEFRYGSSGWAAIERVGRRVIGNRSDRLEAAIDMQRFNQPGDATFQENHWRAGERRWMETNMTGSVAYRVRACANAGFRPHAVTLPTLLRRLGGLKRRLGA